MRIENLAMENTGPVSYFRTDFTADLAILCGPGSKSVLAALAVLTDIRIPPVTMLYGDTGRSCLSAVVTAAQKRYSVCAVKASGLADWTLKALLPNGSDHTAEYLSVIRLSREETACCFFDSAVRNDLDRRLLQYKDPDTYFSDESFSERTEGIGTVNTFRMFLNDYIGNFQPKKVRLGRKEYLLSAENSGKLVLVPPAEEKNDRFPERSEDAAFQYLCFLQVAEFWREFERIRDLNHSIKPIMAAGLDKKSTGTDLGELARRTREQDRQAFWTFDEPDRSLKAQEYAELIRLV